MTEENQTLSQRKEKAEALAALGVTLYSNQFTPQNSTAELLPKGEHLGPQEKEEPETTSLATRSLRPLKNGILATSQVSAASFLKPRLENSPFRRGR